MSTFIVKLTEEQDTALSSFQKRMKQTHRLDAVRSLINLIGEWDEKSDGIIVSANKNVLRIIELRSDSENSANIIVRNGDAHLKSCLVNLLFQNGEALESSVTMQRKG